MKTEAAVPYQMTWRQISGNQDLNTTYVSEIFHRLVPALYLINFLCLRVELGYKVMNGTEYFVIINECCDNQGV